MFSQPNLPLRHSGIHLSGTSARHAGPIRMMDAAAELLIDLWSDYVCPFCYLELPVIDRLQDTLGGRLQVRWRAFELRPEPVPTLDPAGRYLRSTWARSVYPMAERRGMVLKLPPVQPRSRKALETAEYARTHRRFSSVHRALFRAFFEEGRDLGSADVLAQIGRCTGLDEGDLRAALEEGRHSRAVLEDQCLAERLGVQAVPTLIVRRADQRLEDGIPLSGALPYEHLLAVVDDLVHQAATP